MATTASAGHSGTKDFHQVQFTPRVLVALSPTDANAAVGGVAGVAANIVGGGGVGIVSSGEGINTVGTINNSSNNNTNANNNKNRVGPSMKNQLPVIKPDTLFNGTGIFTIYCFVKDFIGASGTSAVAIDNKIEQAMDLVKSHLMIAVREEVEVLKEKISELMDKINQLEVENKILKANMPQETLHQLQMQTQLQIAGGIGPGNMIAAPPPQLAIQQPQMPQMQVVQQQQQQQQFQPPQQQVIMQQPAPQAVMPVNPTTGPMS